MDAKYLRVLVERCRAASRNCFDLRAKEEFRKLAEELAQKADELDSVNPRKEREDEWE